MGGSDSMATYIHGLPGTHTYKLRVRRPVWKFVRSGGCMLPAWTYKNVPSEIQ